MNYLADKDRYSKMEYKRCGKSGLKLPLISLGCWHNFGDNANFDNMKDMLFTAFDNGITHFDIANNYGPIEGSAEINVGRIVNDYMKSYRDELVISTKAGYLMWEGPYGDFGSRKYLLNSLDQSLKRLNLDYVDIFYHHRMDPETPLEETMGALDSAVKSGKALYAGISNYDGETLAKAVEILNDLKCPFIINQNPYSMLNRNIEKNGLIDVARETGKGIIAFSPLSQGLLSDKYIKGIPSDSRIAVYDRYLKKESMESSLDKVIALNEIAINRGQTLAQMALSWVLRDEVVTSVLIGASKPSQIIENCKIVGSSKFTAEELAQIDEICG